MSTATVDPRALAARRRGAIRILRTRVVAGAVAGFLAIWGVLFVQLATGHDPGLNDASTAAGVQTTDPGVAATDAVGDAANDTATGVDSQQAPSAGDDGGAVTTRQS